MDEELIFSTLAQRMSQVTWTRPSDPSTTLRFVQTSRRVRLFGEVPQDMQPWCCQAEHGDTEDQVSGMPYKRVLEANWIIYQCVGVDKSAEPTIENNLILNGVRAALKPQIGDVGYRDRRNTLGGLVYHCYIKGRIFKDPGDLDDQGMIVVPIKLLVP